MVLEEKMELYIHIPFCKKKCRYCDFISYPGQPDHVMEAYIDALLQESELVSQEISESIETVFVGGGTPSLLSPELMLRLFIGLKDRLPLENTLEWTVEANPESCSVAWLDAAIAGGANRISLGMQARQSRLLSLLGRIHLFDEVERSVRNCRIAGFQNLNLDLMFGLPEQSIHDWEETLAAAAGLNPEHMSVYGLIPEPGTPFFEEIQSGKLTLPSEDIERQMYDYAIVFLRKKGYLQYEISNFSKPGYECIHNIGYWTQIPYLGLGIASASMLRVKTDNTGMSYLRRKGIENLDAYLSGIHSGSPLFSEEILITPEEARFETLMLGLRMLRGVSEPQFLKLHNRSLETCYGDKLLRLQEKGLLRKEESAWKLTRRGLDIQNTVLVELMDDT